MALAHGEADPSGWIATRPKQPTPEYPDADALRAWGDLSFLYFRSGLHANLPMHMVRLALQPPIDLGFFRIFRRDGVPRAAITWAYLGEQAEEAFKAGQAIGPADWLSGDRLWIMELLAPYGQGSGAEVTRALRRDPPDGIDRLHYSRSDTERRLRRIVEVRLRPGRPARARHVETRSF